jgi:glycosyltransferase involved in cell wall biosynthesis
MAADSISSHNVLVGVCVAWEIGAWLRADPSRIFHGRSRAGLVVGLWLRLLGQKRVFVSIHCLGRHKWFYRLSASLLGRRLIWLGPSMKRYYGIRDDTWEGCIPDCVIEEDWKKATGRTATGASFRFGCAGSLVPVKRWELVIEALARLPLGRAIGVAFAGGEDGSRESADYAAQLKQTARRLGVSERIAWLGEVSDMQGFYSGVDCLVVASRWEASSVAALEAASVGVPILASDASGTRDIIERASLGWTFPDGNAGSLAAEMMKVVDGGAQGLQPNGAAMIAFTARTTAEAHLARYQAECAV